MLLFEKMGGKLFDIYLKPFDSVDLIWSASFPVTVVNKYPDKRQEGFVWGHNHSSRKGLVVRSLRQLVTLHPVRKQSG